MHVPAGGWNIFARELAAVLELHGARIGQLNDHPKICLHPMMVSRLLKSLSTPKPLVLLNPEDLDLVIKEYGLTSDQQYRLKVAVLATAVERVLMDRVDPDTALMAANEVFHILEESLKTSSIAFRGGKNPFLTAPPSTPAANGMEAALELYDQAVQDLYLAQQTPPDLRPSSSQKALQSFALAMESFERCPASEKQTGDWAFWYHETERGREQAQALESGG